MPLAGQGPLPNQNNAGINGANAIGGSHSGSQTSIFRLPPAHQRPSPALRATRAACEFADDALELLDVLAVAGLIAEARMRYRSTSEFKGTINLSRGVSDVPLLDRYQSFAGALGLPTTGVTTMESFADAIDRYAALCGGERALFRGEQRGHDPGHCASAIARDQNFDEFKPLHARSEATTGDVRTPSAKLGTVNGSTASERRR